MKRFYSAFFYNVTVSSSKKNWTLVRPNSPRCRAAQHLALLPLALTQYSSIMLSMQKENMQKVLLYKIYTTFSRSWKALNGSWVHITQGLTGKMLKPTPISCLSADKLIIASFLLLLNHSSISINYLHCQRAGVEGEGGGEGEGGEERQWKDT